MFPKKPHIDIAFFDLKEWSEIDSFLNIIKTE